MMQQAFGTLAQMMQQQGDMLKQNIEATQQLGKYIGAPVVLERGKNGQKIARRVLQ
jgi:hypothetical protein